MGNIKWEIVYMFMAVLHIVIYFISVYRGEDEETMLYMGMFLFILSDLYEIKNEKK